MAPTKRKLTPEEQKEYDTDFNYFLGFVAISTVAGAVLLSRASRAGFKRFQNAEYITSDVVKEMAKKGKKLRGVVVKVGDADGFRLYHLPAFRRAPKELDKVDLKSSTISIRLAGVDAPEGAAFGSEEQPFYREARSFLEKSVLGKTCEVLPLRKDQYGRIVGMTTVSSGLFGLRRRNVSLDMVTQGLGVVYKATGAAYGGIQNELLAAEEAAKRARRGIWSQDKPVLPGEHKAKMREAKDKGKGKKETLEDDEVPRSLFSRVWGAVFGRR